eukprot:1158216-Pelagomonas_calceolata.AAC.6
MPTRMIGRTGPKGSSQAILMLGVTLSRRVGQIKFPSRLYSVKKVAPVEMQGCNIFKTAKHYKLDEGHQSRTPSCITHLHQATHFVGQAVTCGSLLIKTCTPASQSLPPTNKRGQLHIVLRVQIGSQSSLTYVREDPGI